MVRHIFAGLTLIAIQGCSVLFPEPESPVPNIRVERLPSGVLVCCFNEACETPSEQEQVTEIRRLIEFYDTPDTDSPRPETPGGLF